MKQFKLIKEYPGSPELGDIATFRKDFNDYTINNEWFQPLPEEHIENHSEFWEKVVEKDYEILSFRNIGFENNKSFDDESVLQKDGFYHCIDKNGNSITKNTLENRLKQKCWNIHSIKRLSDGEIFTIDDKVNNSSFGENGVIKSFRINQIYPDQIYITVDFDKQYKDSDDSECFLKNLTKIKQLNTNNYYEHK